MGAARSLPRAERLSKRIESVRATRTWQRGVRHAVSYTVLILGSLFMLFPMLWMVSASFKPPWQIFTVPPIWFPHHWEVVRAGTTNREINIWRVEHNGQTHDVIEIGTRRYTTVIDSGLLPDIQAVQADALSEAAALDIDGIPFNVRTWTTEAGDAVQVVALARGPDDTLLVAPAADLRAAALRLPLDEVNAGSRATIAIGSEEVRGRRIEIEGSALDIIPLGPESQLSVVAPAAVAAQAQLVRAERLIDAGFANIGDTELRLWQIDGDQTQTAYISLVTESWQPVIDEEQLDAHAIVVENDRLGERALQLVNGVEMEVAPYTGADSSTRDVVMLVRGTQRSFVIPIDQASTLRLAQLGGLTSARGDVTERIPYRVQDGFGEGDQVASVALVGDPRDMALVVPQSAVSEAFDVAPAQMERALTPALRLDGYVEALETKVAETYFPRFFVNSFGLVLLNIGGHLFSCVLVAYAFARLRAPGKNTLFLILLASMMLPFPVTIVPVYEIFRDLSMVNTWWPLFLRAYFGNAFLIFMLRQFFTSIPTELEDAARIDGANTLQIILRIVVPLSRPALATVVIFTFWWTWNSFLEPFIFLSSPDLFPVSVGLNFFNDQYGAIYYDRLIAASVLSMLPIVLLFFFAQRYFIEGIQLTGLKG